MCVHSDLLGYFVFAQRLNLPPLYFSWFHASRQPTSKFKMAAKAKQIPRIDTVRKLYLLREHSNRDTWKKTVQSQSLLETHEPITFMILRAVSWERIHDSKNSRGVFLGILSFSLFYFISFAWIINRYLMGRGATTAKETVVGVCHPVLQILTLFQTKKCHFSHRFQTWPLKSFPILRPKWTKCIPVFRPKSPKIYTLWGGTYIYGLHEGVPHRETTVP